MTDRFPATDIDAELDDQLSATLDAMADAFSHSPRSPVLRSPASAGLVYEDVTFPAEDGTPLEGWFVPARAARAVVIVNHPRFFSRSGLPSHLEPWRSNFAETGNDVEVDFIPDIKILHDAGYHVLTYDLRNSGLSGDANGGVTSSGNLESRDVIGSLTYVRSRPDLKGVTIVLFSRCLGADSTLFAMSRSPQTFADVRCFVACQPLSPGFVLERTFERRGLPLELMGELDRRIRLRTSFSLADMSPVRAASQVRVPALVYQVRDDSMTQSHDVQAIFDAVPTDIEKELFWIDGTQRRWDGYLHFQQHPDRVLGWLERFTSRRP